MLEAVWENAVKLAMNHVPERIGLGLGLGLGLGWANPNPNPTPNPKQVPERIGEVVGIVTKRLVEINRHAQAAELYEGVDAHREAIHVYIAGGLWEQARQLCRSAAPQYAREVTLTLTLTLLTLTLTLLTLPLT